MPEDDTGSGLQVRLRSSWAADSKGVTLDLLRVGIGIIWALDLIFILDPANQYFPTFNSVALGYGSQTLGGAGIDNFVAANSVVFAWLIAVGTTYLALAFLFGITTRLACLVGIIMSAFFFWTQFLMTFMIPGGTDVGAHPLYILIYLVLIAGGAGRYFAIDEHLWDTRLARFPALLRFFATPRPTSSSAQGDGARPTPTRPSAPVVRAHGDQTSGAPAPRRGARRGRLIPSRGAQEIALVLGLGLLVMILLGVQFVGSNSAVAPGTGGSVSLVGVTWTITYPGAATTGPFGPANQSDHCADCPQVFPPGGEFSEYVMLTNNGTTPESITSVTVNAPFTVVLGISTPQDVAADGGMLMHEMIFSAPSAPGQYTVDITFTES